MNKIQTKLIAGATGALMLSLLAVPAFAASADSSNNFGDLEIPAFFDQLFGNNLEFEMDGAQEVTDPGDIDGTGQATIKINPGKNQLCVDVETKYIDNATSAHIHNAPKGSAGAVIVPLPIPDSKGEAQGCVDVDSNLLQTIKNNPQDYYLNIYTNAYPEGAIRGQLSR